MSFQELKSNYPKARKEYLCVWCSEKILAKEKHCYRAYISEGDFLTDRMHLECEKAMKDSSHDSICDGFFPGQFGRGEKADDYYKRN